MCPFLSLIVEVVVFSWSQRCYMTLNHHLSHCYFFVGFRLLFGIRRHGPVFAAALLTI